MGLNAWVRRTGRRVFEALGLYPAYLLTHKGPLKEDGWIRSLEEGVPVDAAGRPLPWINYPTIDFLARHVRAEMAVFEYGCGHSTLWWAERVREVVSCEHDREWLERIRPRVPAHVTLRHVPLEVGGAYCRTVAETPGRFDIVVIDGRDRVNCARHAVTGLNAGGVIVWDNTDRVEYRPGIEALGAAGFRRVEFLGMPPGLNEKLETSVFYRDRNVFGL